MPNWLYAFVATETFAVLAEPMRRHLLDLLLDQPRPVGELALLLGLSQPGTSKHLRVLRDAGLVRVRQDAQRRWYELEPGPLTDIDEWLHPYRKFWAGRLDALGRHLDAMPSPAGPDTRMAASSAKNRSAGPGGG